MRSTATIATLVAGALCIVVLALRFMASPDAPLRAHVRDIPLPPGEANDVSYDRAQKGTDVEVVATPPVQNRRASVLPNAPLRRESPKSQVSPAWMAASLAVPLPPRGMQEID